MKDLKLRTKFTLVVSLLILLLGSSFVIFIQTVSLRLLRHQLEDKGFYVAQGVAATSTDLILTDRVADIQKLIDATQEDEEDLAYLYIAGSRGEVLSHTFKDGFPLGLEEINVLPEGQSFQTKLLKTERGLIRDVGVPILEGRVGFVHVGVWEERAITTIRGTTRLLLVITGLILVIGVGVSYTLVRLTVKPLEEVVAGVKAVGRGELDRKVNVRRRDEVGALALAFNKMTDDLANTQERLRKAQRQLIQSEKLGAVGRLAAGVAHEINNAINSILNGVEILVEKQSQPLGSNQKYLDIIRNEAHLCRKIARGLLDFSRPSRMDVEAVDINEVIVRMLLLLEDQGSFRRIKVVKELAEDLPRIEADAGQLQQVFRNLALNAADAMPGGGELQITTSYLDGGGERGRAVRIIFKDTGRGIPPEVLDHILEPFFSTQEAKGGLGLGLSVVYGIITSHSGHLDVQSKAGEGTTFLIELPATRK